MLFNALMRFTDTHTHIYLPEFDSDRDEAVKRALDNGVEKLLMPDIDGRSVSSMISAAERYKGVCLMMAGLHPSSVKADYQEQLREKEALAGNSRVIAIGETGIDLYWDKTFAAEQIISFRRHLQWAVEFNLPAVVHVRKAFAEVFSVIKEFKGTRLRGVFHAFSGGTEEARKAVSLNFMLGIGGVVTFKNSSLGKIVSETGPRYIVLETDSPYLAPVPHRGKRNESAYIPLINRKVAEILGISEEECAEITTGNAMKMFGSDE